MVLPASWCTGSRGSSEVSIQAMLGGVSEQELGVWHMTFTMVPAHSLLGGPIQPGCLNGGPICGEREKGLQGWYSGRLSTQLIPSCSTPELPAL